MLRPIDRMLRPSSSTVHSAASVGSEVAERQMVGGVGLLQPGHLLVGEPQLFRSQPIVQVPRFGGSDDGGGDPRPLEHPSQGNLSRRHLSLIRHFGDTLDDVKIRGLAVR